MVSFNIADDFGVIPSFMSNALSLAWFGWGALSVNASLQVVTLCTRIIGRCIDYECRK